MNSSVELLYCGNNSSSTLYSRVNITPTYTESEAARVPMRTQMNFLNGNGMPAFVPPWHLPTLQVPATVDVMLDH